MFLDIQIYDTRLRVLIKHSNTISCAKGNRIVTIRIVSDLITRVALWLDISIQNGNTKRRYIKASPHLANS